MATATVSTRLEKAEVMELDALSQISGLDRAALIKSIVRRGMDDMRLEMANQQYRSGEITLSRAAELAGMSHWDFIAQMKSQGLQANYGTEELEADLDAITVL
ncbi:MAG: UPF0175 family protein [Verrucomicrobiota bacterium]